MHCISSIAFCVMLSRMKAAEGGRQTSGVQMYTRLCHINSVCVYVGNLPLGCEGLWSQGEVFLASIARGVGLLRELVSR